MSYTGFDDGGVGGDTTTQFGTPDYGQTAFGPGDTTTQFGTPNDKQPDQDYANFADGGGTGTSTGHTDTTTQFGTPSNQSDQPGPTDIGSSDITTSFGTPTEEPPAPRKQQQYEIVPDVSWSPPEGTGQTEFNPGEQSGSAYVQGQDIPSDSLDYFGQAASDYYSNPTDESASAYRNAADRKGAEIENADATDLQNFQDYGDIARQGQQELSAQPQPAGPELQNFQDYSDIARQGQQGQGPSPSGIPSDESTFTTPSGQTLSRTDDGAGYGGWTIAGSDNPSNVLYNDNGNWRAVSRDEARQLQQGGATSDQFTSVANAPSIAGQAMQSTGTTPQTPGFEQRALQAGLMIAGAGLAAPAAGIATTGGEVAGPIFGSALVAPSFSAGGAAASYLFKGTGEHVGETGLFGTAPGKFVMDTLSDIPLAGRYFDAIRSIPIPEAAQNPWSLVTEAIQAVADDPMRLNPIVLAGQIYRNGVAGGGLKNAFNQSDPTFGLQSGIQQAGPEMQSSRLIKDAGSIYGAPFAALDDALKGHFAQAAIDLTHPVTGIGSFLSDVVRPVETYREIYQSELASNGGDPVKAGDAAFRRTNNGVADLLRTLDVFNPLLYSFETPLLETAVAKIFSTAGVTARNLLENVAYGAAGDVANVPARMAGLDARAVANSALRGLDLFTNLSLESGTKIALADTVRDFGTKLGRFDTPGRVGGAAADLIEAFLHRADNPSVADARIADFAKSFTGDVPTARAMSDRLGYGAQQRMLAEGVPLADVPARLEAYATTLRDSAFTPEQLKAARRAFTLGGSDVATVQNQTAFRLISEDLRAAAYKLAGLPIVSSSSAAQTLVDLGARTLRQMFLMPGVAALALKKIPDEFIRGVTQGVWGVSPADLQLVRTAALRLSESGNPALARFGTELQSRSVIRQMLADGVPIDSQLVRGDVNRVGIQHGFSGKGATDNLGRPLTFASRLEALAGGPSRAMDKILEIGASSPTSHVRLNAARQSLNEGAGARGQWLDDTLRGMSRYGVSERDLTAARRAFYDAHPEDVFAAANLSESMGAASPRVPASGMAKGTPSARVMAEIDRTGGSPGLVRSVTEGRTAPTMDEVAATLKSASGPDAPAPKPARASEWADSVRGGKVEPVMVPRDVRDSAEAMGVRYDPAETPKQFADRIAAGDGATVRNFPGRSSGGEMDLAAGGMGRAAPFGGTGNLQAGFGGRIGNRVQANAADARARLAEKYGTLHIVAPVPDLQDIKDVAAIGAEVLWRGISDVGGWVSEMRRVFSRDFATNIFERFDSEKLFDESKKMLDTLMNYSRGEVGALERLVGKEEAIRGHEQFFADWRARAERAIADNGNKVPAGEARVNDVYSALKRAEKSATTKGGDLDTIRALRAEYEADPKRLKALDDWTAAMQKGIDSFGAEIPAISNPDNLIETARSLIRETRALPEGVPPVRLLDLKRQIDLFESGKWGATWYDHTEPILRDIFGPDTEMFIRFLAATSANADPALNLKLAMSAYRNWKLGEEIVGGTAGGLGMMESVGKAAEGIRNGSINVGQWKISDFGLNLLGNTERVTVDRWMLRALGFHDDAVRNWQHYLFAESVYRNLAESVGANPRQVQAAVWAAIRSEQIGKRAVEEPYENLLFKLFENGKLDWMRTSPDPDVRRAFGRIETVDPSEGIRARDLRAAPANNWSRGTVPGKVLGKPTGERDAEIRKAMDASGQYPHIGQRDLIEYGGEGDAVPRPPSPSGVEGTRRGASPSDVRGNLSRQFRGIRDDMNAVGGFGTGRTLGKDNPRGGGGGMGETYYHGSAAGHAFGGDRPAFLTTDRSGARWYAENLGGGRGEVTRVSVDLRNPATEGDLADVVRSLHLTDEDVFRHYPMGAGDNLNDYLYVPEVRRELERRGFDGYKGVDGLERGSIPIAVVWDPDRIAPAGGGATKGQPGDERGNLSRQFRGIRDDMNAMGGFGTGRTLGKDSSRSGQKMTPEMRGQSNFTLDNLRAQAANLPDGMPLKLTSPEKFARQLDDAGDDAGKLQRVYDRIVGTQIAVNRFAKESLAAPHADQIEAYLEDLARVRQPKDGTYSTDRARRVLSDRAAQDEQWRYGEAAGTREAPFSRDGSVPRRTPAEGGDISRLLPEGERYVGRPSPSDLRYSLRPDDMTLAGNGGVMLSDEAAQARRLAAESRAGTRQYLAQRDLDTRAQMRERYAPSRIGGTADGRGVPPPSPIYRPTYDRSGEPRLGPATVPDFAGLADYLRGQGRQLDQILQGRAAGAVERGNSIIGNFREQTPIGELLSRGTINGSSPLHLGSFQLPVLPALPFAAFHVHTTQFWADYFLTHPAVPFAIARALNAYHVDEYGGVQTPDGYVSGVTNPSTAAHLVQWAMDLYRYARDVRNSPNGNSIIQQAAKVVGMAAFGNDAYVRPFDYYSTPAQAALQSTTNPLLTPKGRVDKREQIQEQGAPSLTGSLAQYANRVAGSPLPRNVAAAIGNPAQPITNLIRNAAVAGVNRLGGSADVAAYQAEKGMPYMAGDFGKARGWDDARINAAVTDAMTKNPKTPDGKALLGAYNSQQDVAGLKKALPIQVNEESNGAPYYGTRQPFADNGKAFIHARYEAGEGGRDLGIGRVSKAGNGYVQPMADAQRSTAIEQLRSDNPAVRDYARDFLPNPEPRQYGLRAGTGGRDAGVGRPAGSYTEANGAPNDYYVESPDVARYNTARAEIAKGSPVTPDSVPFMDYNRAYLQNPDIAKMGTAKQQQSLSGEIQGNATRTGAGLPQDQRTAQIAKEMQLEQPIGTNPDGTPYTLGDFLRTPGNVLDLERQYAEAKRNGATKEQLAAISAKIEDAKVRASGRSPIAADYLAGQDASRQATRTAPAPTGDPKKDSLNIEIAPGFAVRDFLGQKGNLFDIQKEYAAAKAAGADKATLAEILKREDAVLASDLKRHPEVRAYFDAIGQLKYAEGQTGSTSSSSRTTSSRTTTSTKGSSSVRTPARSTSYRGSSGSGFRASSAPRSGSASYGAGQSSRNDFFAAYRDPSLTPADKAQLRRDPLVARALDPNSRNGLTPEEFKTATQRIAEQLQHHAPGTSAGPVGFPSRSGTGPGNGSTAGAGSRQTRPGYLSDADILAGRQSDISRQIAQGNIPQGLIESARSAVSGAGSTARYQQDLSSRYGPTSIAQSAPATPTSGRAPAPKGYYYDKGGTLRKSQFN